MVLAIAMGSMKLATIVGLRDLATVLILSRKDVEPKHTSALNNLSP